jgi:hypothetical protein
MLRPMLVALALAFAFAVGLVVTLPATPRAAQVPPIDVTCTFANASYAGDCVEKTTRMEKQKAAAACKPILDCLNNSRCAKSYCQATTVRAGWTLKKAE